MAIMSFDEEYMLDEPCLSCKYAYMEDIWNEWCCDKKECPYKSKESEDKEMSKCRYDLSEDCENKNCVKCTLEKLRADVTELLKEPAMYVPNYDAYRRVIKIIDKYREENER